MVDCRMSETGANESSYISGINYVDSRDTNDMDSRTDKKGIVYIGKMVEKVLVCVRCIGSI